MRLPLPDDTGLRWEADQGLPTRVTSRDGTVLVRARSDLRGPRLVLTLPDGGAISLVLDAASHPVLGPCDALRSEPDDRALALASRVDWRCPDRIPAVDRPGTLPRGAGTALLNLLAWQAVHAGRGPLRYHGPYPSLALWRSLQASFRVDPGARDRFLADAEARALAGTGGELPVDFHPAPHAWHWPRPRVCVQRRAGVIERVYVEGHPYERSSSGLRRLIARDSTLVAAIVLGSEVWCERLTLDPTGEPRGAPHPLPSAPAALCGTPLPEPVVQVLGEVITAQAPRLLQPALRTVLASTRVQWGDPSPSLVHSRESILELHAGLLAALPTDSTTLLGVLIQLLEDPLRQRAAVALDRAWSAHTGHPGAGSNR